MMSAIAGSSKRLEFTPMTNADADPVVIKTSNAAMNKV